MPELVLTDHEGIPEIERLLPTDEWKFGGDTEWRRVPEDFVGMRAYRFLQRGNLQLRRPSCPLTPPSQA